MIDADFISYRIAKLTTEKNISARDMSLSLGQSQSYINNIENKKALPSMQMFLYICEFLGVEPKDFFEEDVTSPSILNEAVATFKSLSPKQLEMLIAIAKEMKEGGSTEPPFRFTRKIPSEIYRFFTVESLTICADCAII